MNNSVFPFGTTQADEIKNKAVGFKPLDFNKQQHTATHHT